MFALRVLPVLGAFVISLSAPSYAADLPRRHVKKKHPPITTARPIVAPAPVVSLAPVEPLSAESGFYGRVDGGISVFNARPLLASGECTNCLNAPIRTTSNLTTNSGTNAGIGLGYRVSSWLRFDLTGEYRWASDVSAKQTVVGTIAGNAATYTQNYKGHLSSLVGLLNTHLDLGTWSGITPFVGVGFGVASNRLSALAGDGELTTASISPSNGSYKTKTSAPLAWAMSAGLAYDLSRSAQLELSYRYLHLGGVESGQRSCSTLPAQISDCSGTLKANGLAAQDYRLGVRWALGQK